ncbi:MAG: pyridoxal-phosphate dependent enzyme [Rhizobiaceae bacterium]|nr:pyridoxal-phosphate dependent enzyme [Rhizobiaceae bacterium]
MSLHINTPLLHSEAMSLASGRSIWLKFDALQPSGSFKIRGIGRACTHHRDMGKRKFVSSSGGNAGLAVAYAGQQLGIPVTVVVPQTTSQRAIGLISQLGAQVIVEGASWQEANEACLKLLTDDDAFIHPFDDPLLWEGHATIVDEIPEERRPDLVVVSVGGGGLLSGVALGLERRGWRTPILAVETAGASSLAQSIAAGERVTLPAITSIASSLGAKQVSEHAFSLTQSYPVKPVTVSDRDAVKACLRFLDDHRVLVEPACGANLAAVYDAKELDQARNVLVVVCGGSSATLQQLQNWDAELA